MSSLKLRGFLFLSLFLTVPFIFAACSKCSRQNLAQPDVERTFGGQGDDRAFSIDRTLDGGYIIAGDTRSFGAGGQDLYLVKTDDVGTELWSRTFGGSGDDSAREVHALADGGFIIVGHTNSMASGGEDIYLVRTDGDGEEVWSKTLGGAEADRANSIKLVSTGGFILAGETSSSGAGGSDAILIRVDESGDVLWEKVFGGNGRDTAQEVVEMSDGGFAIVGGTLSPGANDSDTYLVTVDSDGNGLLEATYESEGSEIGMALAPDVGGAGFIVVLGQEETIPTDYHVPVARMLVMSVDGEREVAWLRSYIHPDPPVSSVGHSIVPSSSAGGFYPESRA